MKALHSWDVDVEEAVRIQETLKDRISLVKTFSEVTRIGGGDVAYFSRDQSVATVAVFSFPELNLLDSESVSGKVDFPYISGLFSFREGFLLIRAFQRLKAKPDVMMFDGQGIAHPRGLGLASHLGLWLDIPSIGCAKSPFFRMPIDIGTRRGDVQIISKDGRQIGAALRTKDKVKPVYVSPGHRIDLFASVQLVLAACRGYRIPEPLRGAHQISHLLRRKS